MENNISIKIFRVSADSKYLEMVFKCDPEYHFKSLNLEVKYFIKKDLKSITYNLSDALFTDPEQKRYAVKIPLAKLDIDFPAIYVGTFTITDGNGEYTEADTAVCSDVNYAYKCMLDDLFMNEGECEDVIPDELIRKYLLLYGHQAALQAHDFESAETYFRLIGNCFNACAPTGRGTGSCCNKHISQKPCNCGR